MNKYNVSISFGASNGIEVEADSPEQAAEMAYNHDSASPSLCHQCSKEVELGDAVSVTVFDETGLDELFCDGWQEEEIAKLRARGEELEKEVAHWKSNHDNRVEAARVLIDRADLPLERVKAYESYVALQARCAELESIANHRKVICDEWADINKAEVAHNLELQSKLATSESSRRDAQSELERYKAENTDLRHKLDRLEGGA